MRKAKLFILVRLPVCILVWSLIAQAQTPQQSNPEPRKQDQTEVLRVYTELVQTDVMVFDRDGNFVNGLKPEDFDLRIDGKSKPIAFFEKVTAGSISEESQIAAARGSVAQPIGNGSVRPAPLDRGRPIFFYVDDFHLDLTGMQATKKLIAHFIDNEMGQNDEAAITSANGQIGFLQQLTDNRAVLHAALERLKSLPVPIKDIEQPPMTEYQALQITRGDPDSTSWFIAAIKRDNPYMTDQMASAIVNQRARTLVRLGGSVTTNTLTGLEGLVKSANKLPGRKLVFFISGGFLIDDVNSDTQYRLRRIVSAAARSGIVIYSLDARGLIASLTDASEAGNFDPSGVLSRAGMGEITATQDGMNALASDTGGRATFNTNALEPGLKKALKETSTYYLLAWKPEQTQSSSKFRRIEVKLVNKPNLTVQLRRGFYDREPEATVSSAAKPTNNKNSKEAAATPEQSSELTLRKEILSAYPDREIPVSLSLSYVDTAKGMLLSTALQVPNEFFSFQPTADKQTALVAVAGTVFDEKGNAGAHFGNRLTIETPSAEAVMNSPPLAYAYSLYLKPGLYQVRVGVRDERTGRIGTAHSWVEVPNWSAGQLGLSSLMLGLRTQPSINASASSGEIAGDIQLSINHNFSSGGFLRFLVFVYHASLGADSKPDVAIQLQIVRDGQPVITTLQKKIFVDGVQDLTRIPYAAEISLNGLPAGRYILQVTIVDRVSKKSATQQTRFEIN